MCVSIFEEKGGNRSATGIGVIIIRAYAEGMFLRGVVVAVTFEQIGTARKKIRIKANYQAREQKKAPLQYCEIANFEHLHH